MITYKNPNAMMHGLARISAVGVGDLTTLTLGLPSNLPTLNYGKAVDSFGNPVLPSADAPLAYYPVYVAGPGGTLVDVRSPAGQLAVQQMNATGSTPPPAKAATTQQPGTTQPLPNVPAPPSTNPVSGILSSLTSTVTPIATSLGIQPSTLLLIGGGLLLFMMMQGGGRR